MHTRRTVVEIDNDDEVEFLTISGHFLMILQQYFRVDFRAKFIFHVLSRPILAK